MGPAINTYRLPLSQDFMDDDRGNNEKRVVRTEKDKKWNLIKDITAKITSALNNQDFEKVWNQLQELLKEIEKAQKIIDKEGYPPLFLRCLKKINDEINEFNENAEAKKKMKKHSATAFNTMKQKLKKIYPEFEQSINDLLAKGEEESEEESEEIEESSDEESDEEDDKRLLESSDPMVRRKYWLKKPKRKEESDEEKKEEKGEKVEKGEKGEKIDEKKKEKKINITKKKTNL